ncbi:MAG: hypothetical protein ABIJ59_05565 [Pseudomonadota bacterium]
MNNTNKFFEVEKSFGMGVLLKLTKNGNKGIKICSDGEKFTSNVTLNELSNAVDATLKTHNIRLKIQ